MSAAAPAVSPSLPRYVRAAGIVRERIADGSLKPGAAAPSGAALARLTGFSTLTCRKALRVLIADGVLVPGPSRNARPRAAAAVVSPAAEAAARLSAALAGRRRKAGLAQHELAVKIGWSVTTVRHAETGRAWQSRRFWERADEVLAAGGELLRLYDDCRAAAAPPGDGDTAAGPVLVCVLAVWSDGSAVAVPGHLAAAVAAGLGTALPERPG